MYSWLLTFLNADSREDSRSIRFSCRRHRQLIGNHKRGVLYNERERVDFTHRPGKLLCHTLCTRYAKPQFVIRVGLALEAHGLWVPMQVYKDIIAGGVTWRRVKSSSFVIPAQYWDGCPSIIGQISIQAAFVCLEWTWVFVDHNVMITFHVMALRATCSSEDLRPGSKVNIILNLWN